MTLFDKILLPENLAEFKEFVGRFGPMLDAADADPVLSGKVNDFIAQEFRGMDDTFVGYSMWVAGKEGI